MTGAEQLIAALSASAAEADAREAAYKQEAAATMQRLEGERTIAYRRLNFMRTLAGLAASAETPDAAVGAVKAHVRAAFGWDGDTDARTQVLERIAPVGLALHALAHPLAEGDAASPPCLAEQESFVQTPVEALAAFESWYLETRESPFWYLFDYYMPETPRVDY
ncbi:hypothetical protein ACLBXM_02085 [Xanthobacteraceae bacterium A53D]